MLKRTCKIIFLLLLLFPILLLLPFFIAPIVDDIALTQFKSHLIETLALPPNTQMVDVVSGCGNTGGTGNHTELYVGILLKTTLSQEEWNLYYPNVHNVFLHGETTWSMSAVNLSFSKIDNPQGHYILEKQKTAPWSNFDIRGH